MVAVATRSSIVTPGYATNAISFVSCLSENIVAPLLPVKIPAVGPR
jgi:hypothetical protein